MAGIEHDYTRLFEVAHRLTDGLAERTTAISHSAAGYYIRRKAVPASKMMVVPNGIDSGGFEHDPTARGLLRRALGIEDQFAWLAVARLEPAKAYPTLLRAFAGLGDGPRTLLICGQGSRRGELEGLAHDLGIGGRVKFLGLRDDIPAVMSAADAFALSSDLEGLPLVLLQAAAAGLPIVATDVGGNAEVVEPGVIGEIVAPGDPGAFSRAMLKIEALSPPERAAMGDAGLSRVRTRFEAERVVDRWEALYTELLDDAARPMRRRSAAPRGDEAPTLVTVSTPGPLQGRDHAT
jgi:glycosyltransferase involved in cell wall biosynthesis